MDGMAQAVAGLEITPDYVRLTAAACRRELIQPPRPIVDDANSASIAAASILAKVSREAAICFPEAAGQKRVPAVPAPS